jgi:uncharacterized protein (TIGR02300 family)
MKKATQKSAPVSLGTKRVCPDCATKFYDFNKDPIQCPKCASRLDPQALNPLAKVPTEPKKPAKVPEKGVVAEGEEIVIDDSDPLIESVDDLGDEDEELVDDLDVDEDEENES